MLSRMINPAKLSKDQLLELIQDRDKKLAARSKEADDYEPLLPWNWAVEHPEAIRTYRQEERWTRDLRKEDKRDRRRANKAR